MTPNEIVFRLEQVIGVAGPPLGVRIAIEHVLIDHFALPPIQAAEKAEQFSPRVIQLINRKHLSHQAAGTISILCVLGTTQDSVAGSCHVLPQDVASVRQAKMNRVHAEPLLAAIRALTFQEFELFAGRVLKELGAQHVRVTSHSNDQGIDFYGILNLGALQQIPPAFFKLAHDVEIRFAGQAKHYPDRSIGPNVVRELVGAISLARYKTYSVKTSDLFEDLELRPFNPLLALLFTTGEITPGAADLAVKAGMVARTGAQLSVFLADRGIGMVMAPDQSVVFSDQDFLGWLNET